VRGSWGLEEDEEGSRIGKSFIPINIQLLFLFGYSIIYIEHLLNT
jgi:hypothetical protein